MGAENVLHKTAGVAQCRRGKIIQDFDIENLTIWKAMVLCAEDSTNRKTSKKARWAVFCRSVLPSSGGRREVASSKVTSVSLLAMLGLPLPPLSYTYPTDVTSLWVAFQEEGGRGVRKG